MIQMQDINSLNIQKLNCMLDKASDIAIVTHMKPDGDAIGSSLALHSYLTSEGKKCKVVLPHRHPSNLDFLFNENNRRDIVTHEITPEEATRTLSESDLIICLDFNAFHRTDTLEITLRESNAHKILIDHHLNPDRSRFDLSFSEINVSSASELLYHILMALPQTEGRPEKLPKTALNALMTGMTTDTNNFANSVFPSTLRMASGLLSAGADRDEILSNLYNMFGEKRLRLLGLMLKDLMTVTDDGVAYMILDDSTLKKYNVSEGDTEGFVNMPLSIKEVRMSILLKEDRDRIRVSIRSKKGTSANRCAREHFNGGGHENAAGGRLLVPQDLQNISLAAQYIEEHTHQFFKDEK